MLLVQPSDFRVPTKRPHLLRELRSQLPSADDRVRDVSGHDPTEYEAVADALYRVFNTARNLAPPRNTTNCTIHPNGPVDPEPPQGWGRCLFCNGNRRIGNPQARSGGPVNANQYDVPPPPYTHEILIARMRRINDAVYELALVSPDDAFADVADLVHGAFVIARELSRPRSTSKCRLHPGAPIDPDAPGGPQCLFCSTAAIKKERAVPPPQIRDRVRHPARRRRAPRPPKSR
ncbi:hypothetical protein LT966_28785 [Streptomyces griseobrunneus]|uniref:hypothetical protein n=1 Tax=Streptomyces sp. SAI-25 TaxID=1472664 RepID=UPI003895C817